MSFEPIRRDEEQHSHLPFTDLTNNKPSQNPVQAAEEPFKALGKSPQQLVQRVQQQMQRGQKLSVQEMNWAFSHGGFYFHQQAGLHNSRIRKQEEAEQQAAEAGKNSVDSGEGIMQLMPQPDSPKKEELKKRQAPDPFSAGGMPVNTLARENEEQVEQEQQTAKQYGGGGEEKKVRNVKGYILKEFDLSKAILGTLFGSYYDLIKKSSFWDVKAKASFESEFEKDVAKGEKIQFSKAYFPVEAKGRLDEHFYKVSAAVFKNTATDSFTDPENPAINFKLTGNLSFLDTALKGIEPEINIAKIEGKATYTITRANLDTSFPGISAILQESWPALYSGVMNGETNLKLVFSLSLAFQLKDIAKLIKNALTQAAKKAAIEKHKEKIGEQKTKERDFSNDKKAKTTEKNKLNDEISKKEKQLKKLDKASSEADLQKKAKLQEELAEKQNKLQKIQSEIDEAKDAIDESRKAQKAEKEGLKQAKEKFRKAKAENKKLTSAKKKGGKLTKAQRLNKYADKVITKGAELADKIIQKTVNKTVQKIVKKAILTVVKMALRLIPVIGWLISAWDLITTLWDIGKAIWDWFTDDDKDKKDGTGDGESTEGETLEGNETTGQGGEGTGTGEGTDTGSGSGNGSGTTQGTGSGTSEGGSTLSGSSTSQAGQSKTQQTGGAEKTSGTESTVQNKETQNKEDEKLEDEDNEQRTDIPVREVPYPQESTQSLGFSNLNWIAPKEMTGKTLISHVKLEGLYENKYFSTAAVFEFEYKSVDGKIGYYPTKNFIFVIGGKKRIITTKHRVSKFTYQ
jgi:hypothetical protein